MTGLICSSFCWENGCILVQSYNSMDGNWQGTLVKYSILCKMKEYCQRILPRNRISCSQNLFRNQIDPARKQGNNTPKMKRKARAENFYITYCLVGLPFHERKLVKDSIGIKWDQVLQNFQQTLSYQWICCTFINYRLSRASHAILLSKMSYRGFYIGLRSQYFPLALFIDG